MSQKTTAHSGVDDIPAITLITKEINNIIGVRDPPSDYEAEAKYRKNMEKITTEALDTFDVVCEYAVRVNEKIDELREALKNITNRVHDAIEENFKKITSSGNRILVSAKSVQQMRHTTELIDLEVSKKRLEEAAVKTKLAYDKLKNNVDLTKNDVDNLRGYMDSWKQAKQKSYDDEKREEMEAQDRVKQRHEEEKRRREEEKERKEREEEEKQRREEEERQKAEEEARQKEEEERQRLKEEERLRREEEERLEREKADEERKKRDEEDRKQQREEEEKKRQEEQARRDAEARVRERLRKEEEDRRRRLDPRNWQSITYTRASDHTAGSLSHHRGVCSVLTMVPGSMAEDDIQCLASDEDRDLLPALADGEKVLSSMIALESQKGKINLEAPLRLYVPHQKVEDVGDELVAKVKVDEGEWMMTRTIPLPAKPLMEEDITMTGVQLDDFVMANIIIVARPRCQNIIIDKPGTSQYSMYDKNVKLLAPPEAFKKPTEVKFSVKPIPEDIRVTVEKSKGSDSFDSIITTGPLVSLACQTAPEKDIEIDLLRSSKALSADKPIKGNTYQLMKTNKSGWQIADVTSKGHNKGVSITLPAMKTHYSVIELEVTRNMPKDEVVKVAGDLYDCMNKSVVQVLVRQKAESPEHVMVHCLRREAIDERLKKLSAIDYTQGPETSREFYLFDGQKVRFSYTGNVESAIQEKKELTMPFYAYMDTTKYETVLHVRDKYKQRELSQYVGNVHCQVLPFVRSVRGEPHHTHNHPGSGGHQDHQGDVMYDVDIELPVCLPQRESKRFRVKTAEVRFPHYWKSLTVFLAWKLAGSEHAENYDVDWFTVLCEIGGKKSAWTSRRNQAKNKSADDSEQSICRIVLEDWMKVTNVHDDKLGPIKHALGNCKLHGLAQECEDFVKYHRDKLSDRALRDIADKLSGNPQELGDTLGLQEDTTKKCISDNLTSETLQVIAVMEEWRQSLGAIKEGTNALKCLTPLV